MSPKDSAACVSGSLSTTPHSATIHAMLPRAVFFDMDDTLLDTSRGVEESWQLVCREFAPRLSADPVVLREAIKREATAFWRDEAAVEQQWRTRLHEARRHVVEVALASEQLDVSVAEELSMRYWTENSGRMGLFDDALHTLETLRSRGYRLGLITNGPAEMQLAKVARFQLEPYFDVIVIEGVFGKGKPAPEVFTHALESTGSAANEAWHVGDNLYADIAGAQKVGIHGVWIHRERLEMKEAPAAIPDRVVAHLDELVAVL